MRYWLGCLFYENTIYAEFFSNTILLICLSKRVKKRKKKGVLGENTLTNPQHTPLLMVDETEFQITIFFDYWNPRVQPK